LPPNLHGRKRNKGISPFLSQSGISGANAKIWKENDVEDDLKKSSDLNADGKPRTALRILWPRSTWTGCDIEWECVARKSVQTGENADDRLETNRTRPFPPGAKPPAVVGNGRMAVGIDGAGGGDSRDHRFAAESIR
jgi:hypothetical protein